MRLEGGFQQAPYNSIEVSTGYLQFNRNFNRVDLKFNRDFKRVLPEAVGAAEHRHVVHRVAGHVVHSVPDLRAPPPKSVRQ
jgi:hypothetical protein